MPVGDLVPYRALLKRQRKVDPQPRHTYLGPSPLEPVDVDIDPDLRVPCSDGDADGYGGIVDLDLGCDRPLVGSGYPLLEGDELEGADGSLYIAYLP